MIVEDSENLIQQALVPGSSLSFSARSNDPMRFRRVYQTESDRLSNLIKAFPDLHDYVSGNVPPIVVNHYPSVLGPIPSVVVVDTFMRQVNFSRALHLSAIANRTCIVLGQPLSIAEFFHKHLGSEGAFPRNIVVVSGGYVCPKSLEEFISGMLSRTTGMHMFLHGYGVAEVEYGIFVGRRSAHESLIHYVHIADHIEWKVENGLLHLRDRNRMEWFCTDDIAFEKDDGIIIENDESRVRKTVLQELEDWTEVQWKRRTGYVSHAENGLTCQCRVGVCPNGRDEVEFFEFCRSTGMSFADKPDWR